MLHHLWNVGVKKNLNVIGTSVQSGAQRYDSYVFLFLTEICGFRFLWCVLYFILRLIITLTTWRRLISTCHIFTEMHNDIPQIHSPPTDKILWRSYQVAKLQEIQAGTLKTSADRSCDITTGCPSVCHYELARTSSIDEYWHTHKTMPGLGFLWHWPWKIMYSVMRRLTVWQILTDVLGNTTAHTCGV
jgi:hypothetical protein